MQNTCFFIGHRNAPHELLPALAAEVERHIRELGVTEFLVGHYGNFDRLAASAVKQVKKRYPEVKLTMLLPYHPSVQKYEPSSGFDGSFYPPGLETVPKPYAIPRANRYAIEHSGHLICYDCGKVGNTRKLVELARRRERRGEMTVVNLADSTRLE